MRARGTGSVSTCDAIRIGVHLLFVFLKKIGQRWWRCGFTERRWRGDAAPTAGGLGRRSATQLPQPEPERHAQQPPEHVVVAQSGVAAPHLAHDDAARGETDGQSRRRRRRQRRFGYPSLFFLNAARR